jgi:hypothetical protein
VIHTSTHGIINIDKGLDKLYHGDSGMSRNHHPIELTDVSVALQSRQPRRPKTAA